MFDRIEIKTIIQKQMFSIKMKKLQLKKGSAQLRSNFLIGENLCKFELYSTFLYYYI